MKKILNYVNNSYIELTTKVSWPTWEELRESTVIVLIASLIFAIVVYLTDAVVSKGLEQFYKIFQ